MTYEECQQQFEQMYEESVGSCPSCGHPIPQLTFKALHEQDETAVRTAFNDYTDGLCKDGDITIEQYEEWDNPY